jgi:hypothetical protein
MGSTRWQYAGLSLIPDDSRIDWGRATTGLTRTDLLAPTPRGLVGNTTISNITET